MKLRWFEKLFVRSPLRIYFHRKSEAAKVLSNLGIAEGSTCLEIGCGQGVGALLINQYLRCERVVCIDIDPEMIRAAKRYFSHPPSWARDIRTDNIELVYADATSLSFADNSFDGAFHFAVLDHVKEWRRVITEVYRVLKPGGVFSFEDFLLPDSPLYLHQLFGHVPISEAELKEALESSGFSIVSFEKARSHVCFIRANKKSRKD